MNKKVKDISEFDYLIGQKVPLNVEIKNTVIFGKNKSYSFYTMADARLEEKLNSLAENVRVFLPGTVGTMDYRLDRLNINITEQGIIDRVYYG